MARDVKFWKEDGSFKLRVCGIFKHGNKYLINNNSGFNFWSFAGGHVELGETSDKAVLRECKEEVGIDAKINKHLATLELIFEREDGKPFHEISFYYLMDDLGKLTDEDFTLEEMDKGVKRLHNFKWVTLDEFDKYDVRPKALKQVLQQGLQNQHITWIEK